MSWRRLTSEKGQPVGAGTQWHEWLTAVTWPVPMETAVGKLRVALRGEDLSDKDGPGNDGDRRSSQAIMCPECRTRFMPGNCLPDRIRDTRSA